ncbi:hypothetical protein HY946_00430 [Candidatus Gottesmanbacteria bacterium]|nr:hypothetical protein [Candidatus Gottesmanbacteria bacterium]
MKKVQIWKAITFGKVKIFLLLLFFLIEVVLTVNFFLLEEKFKDLRWENALLQQKIDSLNEVTDTFWQERAFEKEMKENLAYYLPVGYNQTATFLDLTPIDLKSTKARVKFLYAGKTHTVDFSYYSTGEGWNINRISPVTLEP